MLITHFSSSSDLFIDILKEFQNIFPAQPSTVKIHYDLPHSFHFTLQYFVRSERKVHGWKLPEWSPKQYNNPCKNKERKIKGEKKKPNNQTAAFWHSQLLLGELCCTHRTPSPSHSSPCFCPTLPWETPSHETLFPLLHPNPSHEEREEAAASCWHRDGCAAPSGAGCCGWWMAAAAAVQREGC